MSKKKETFETQLSRLETIVQGLESGDRGLEESLTLFEEGVSLAKSLTSRLDEVKRKVEVLTKDAQGALNLKALEGEEPPGGGRAHPETYDE
ncbi:MAG: exodeoxyribonuclease VII small subunit [Elusimicrobia bacterium]|nr:exodeoxyribonuclease VII small subunit [Elusimicrobiota bacterium]